MILAIGKGARVKRPSARTLTSRALFLDLTGFQVGLSEYGGRRTNGGTRIVPVPPSQSIVPLLSSAKAKTDAAAE
jgi:hypothetical protein